MIASKRRGCDGFSLLELLVVLAVIGIVGSVTITVLNRDWQRSKLSNTAVEWAAWFELVRKAAQRTESGCAITVSPLSTKPSGTVVAVVRNLGVGESRCSAESALVFVAPSQGDLISISVTDSVLIFTPRGTILGSSASTLDDGWELRMSLSSANAMRCIRLSSMLGAMQIGSNPASGDLSAPCSDYSNY